MGFVGKGTPFTILEVSAVRPFVAAVTQQDDSDETPSTGGDDKGEKKSDRDQNLDDEEERERKATEEQASKAEAEAERPEVSMTD